MTNVNKKNVNTRKKQEKFQKEIQNHKPALITKEQIWSFIKK